MTKKVIKKTKNVNLDTGGRPHPKDVKPSDTKKHTGKATNPDATRQTTATKGKKEKNWVYN